MSDGLSFAEEGERLLALICVLNAEGYRINNLFQRESGGLEIWQANLTKGGKFWEFGIGGSPLKALEAAREWTKAEEGLEAIVPVPSAASPVRRSKSAILTLDLDL